MTLTRQKPKAHYRKRQGQHHRHSKVYLKTYWPYLPMLAIIGLGAFLNKALYNSPPAPLSSAGAALAQSGNSSRLQGLFGNSSSKVFLIALAITAVAFSIFILTYWYRLYRYINKGELFIIRHPAWEIATVSIFTVGYILTRSR